MQTSLELKNEITSNKIRRVYTTEFCRLAGAEGTMLYRPQVELLRMITIGEAWSVQADDDWLMQLLIPIVANVKIASSFREFVGDVNGFRGNFIMPPVGFFACKQKEEMLALSLAKMQEIALRRSPHSELWAVLEYTKTSLDFLPTYLSNGFYIVALAPMYGIAPCYVLKKFPQFENKQAQNQNEKLYISIEESTRLALLLGRGWAVTNIEKRKDGDFFILVRKDEV